MQPWFIRKEIGTVVLYRGIVLVVSGSSGSLHSSTPSWNKAFQTLKYEGRWHHTAEIQASELPCEIKP
ncbi:hypothetical protein BCV73_07570 [Paenibacillus sp. SSG-1]|uniref:hypothetical protein n=1 Tax=Paenibacillus sp. SSG-1 TaxID=1443669 RepID=UPI000B7D7866|nr:hypothetical protein [Paenibacillus sp. SSG-1]OXL82955.1 hypothetical protein BCV73_07570 [Paenibacillus sp. SSG-1]